MRSCTSCVRGETDPPLVLSRADAPDFGTAVGRHLEVLQRKLMWEHQRVVMVRSAPEVQEMVKAMQKEIEELRGSSLTCPQSPRLVAPSPQPPETALSIEKPTDGVVGICELASTSNGNSPALTALAAQLAAQVAAVTSKMGPEAEHGDEVDVPRVCSCGNTFKGDAAFCRNCGKQREGICKCGNILAMDAHFCRKCGRRQEDGTELKEDRKPWKLWLEAGKNVKERHLTEKQKNILKGDGIEEKKSVAKQLSFWSRHDVVIHPDTKRYLAWQLLFTAVLSYELIMFPMGTFNIPKQPGDFISIMSWLCVIFWSIDLLFTFFTGYYTAMGDLVLSHRMILSHYMKTWFIPDITVVLVDWVEVAGPDGGGSMKFAKLLRYLRVARLLRLLRLRKLREAIHQVDEFINSAYFSIIKTLILNMVGIVVISHFLGCLWYMVGQMEFEGYTSWVVEYEFDKREWVYSYLTSLHWAICQFTPGGMHIQPQNNAERIFAIMMLVLGMIIFSSIVSNITRATTDLKNITARYDLQLAAVRRFFRQQNMSKELLHRVHTYAENVIKPKMKGIQIQEVELLRVLPKPMHMEVIGELYCDYMEVHYLFKTIKFLNVIVMQKLCVELNMIALSAEAGLFAPGEIAHSMYFVCAGKLVYNYRGTGDPVTLEVGQFAVEVVLWTAWILQGKLSSCSAECDLISLHYEGFQNVLSQHPGTIWLPKKYGAEFVKQLNILESSDEQVPEHHSACRAICDLLTVPTAVEICKSA